MPQQTISKPRQRRKSAAKPVEVVEYQDDKSGSDSEESEIMGKDQDEEDLDRMVLGDSAGFLDRLGNADFDNDEDEEEGSGKDEADLEADVGLEGVDDADVSTDLAC